MFKLCIAFIFYMAIMGCFGCEVKRAPQGRWIVKLVRPDGYVHAKWTVESRLEPKSRPLLGGQIELYGDNGEGTDSFGTRYERLGLLAPTGWVFEVEQSQ